MGIIFRKRLKNIPGETVKKGIIIGLFQVAALSVQLFGLQFTTTAKQSFLVPSYVVFVPFLSWIIYRKSPGMRAVFSGIISLAGIGFITIKEGFSLCMGDSVSLISALLLGLEILYIAHAVTEDVDVYQMSFVDYIAAAVTVAVICLIKGAVSGDWFESFRMSFSGESLIGVIYLGSFNTVFAFTAQNIAQQYTRPSTAALLMGLESVFGFFFSIIYYKEAFTIRFLIGAALCFGAILMATTGKKDDRNTDERLT